MPSRILRAQSAAFILGQFIQQSEWRCILNPSKCKYSFWICAIIFFLSNIVFLVLFLFAREDDTQEMVWGGLQAPAMGHLLSQVRAAAAAAVSDCEFENEDEDDWNQKLKEWASHGQHKWWLLLRTPR